jgi:hypothetical protein
MRYSIPPHSVSDAEHALRQQHVVVEASRQVEAAAARPVAGDQFLGQSQDAEEFVIAFHSRSISAADLYRIDGRRSAAFDSIGCR